MKIVNREDIENYCLWRAKKLKELDTENPLPGTYKELENQCRAKRIMDEYLQEEHNG